ncbi:MAG: ZIP family metal transporter [Candidatus Pacebacteria bacterium]|nr:ZIP family metal transporter [Candidatus Paceibacterota bacterium]
MITTYLYALGSVLAVSLVSLIGIFGLSLKEEWLKKYIFIFISLAVGALLGDAFIHLIPEAFEEASNPLLISLLIISGILFFFILEKFLHWHHHGDDTEENHIHPVGKLVLFSDGVHNFIDGVIIGASFLVSIPLGIATTLAVILHEIPQEIGDFAVLLHAGYTKARALWLNFLSALLSIAGVIIALVLGDVSQNFIIYFLPIAAGGFIYIAVADLIPELHKTKETKYSFLQFLSLILGVFLMITLTFIE